MRIVHSCLINLHYTLKNPLTNCNKSFNVSIRLNDAGIPVIKLDDYQLGIGLNYDVNVSRLASASQLLGGLDSTLSYKTYLNVLNSSRIN